MATARKPLAASIGTVERQVERDWGKPWSSSTTGASADPATSAANTPSAVTMSIDPSSPTFGTLPENDTGRSAPMGSTTIARLHHNAWVTKDQEATRRFYEDLIGLPLV